MPKGIAIYPDKRVDHLEVDGLKDYQEVVKGLIEAVGLKDGSTMYVNEEYRYQFGPVDFNSVATDVASLGGRPDIMFTGGILGPVLILGPVDDDGNDTDVTDRALRWVRRVHREAV